MEWLLIFDLVADGAALACTGIATFFAYRTATIPISEDSFEDDMRRQSHCGTYATLTGALAAALLVAA